jgi:hypothetical protein
MATKERKIEGPRVRETRPFIAVLNCACAEINANPNSGTPELIRKGMKMMSVEAPKKYWRFVNAASRTTGLSIEEILEIINR